MPSKHPHLRSTTENGLCDIFSPWPASYKHLARTSRGNEVKFQKHTVFRQFEGSSARCFCTKIGIVWLYFLLMIIHILLSFTSTSTIYIYICVIKYVCLKYVPWNTHDILHIYGKHFEFDSPVVWGLRPRLPLGGFGALHPTPHSTSRSCWWWTLAINSACFQLPLLVVKMVIPEFSHFAPFPMGPAS